MAIIFSIIITLSIIGILVIIFWGIFQWYIPKKAERNSTIMKLIEEELFHWYYEYERQRLSHEARKGIRTLLKDLIIALIMSLQESSVSKAGGTNSPNLNFEEFFKGDNVVRRLAALVSKEGFESLTDELRMRLLISLNPECLLRPTDLNPYLEELDAKASTYVFCEFWIVHFYSKKYKISFLYSLESEYDAMQRSKALITEFIELIDSYPKYSTSYTSKLSLQEKLFKTLSVGALSPNESLKLRDTTTSQELWSFEPVHKLLELDEDEGVKKLIIEHQTQIQPTIRTDLARLRKSSDLEANLVKKPIITKIVNLLALILRQKKNDQQKQAIAIKLIIVLAKINFRFATVIEEIRKMKSNLNN